MIEEREKSEVSEILSMQSIESDASKIHLNLEE